MNELVRDCARVCLPGHGGRDLHGVLPEVPPPDARHAQVLPLVHLRLQEHLLEEEGGDRRPRRQDEHRWVVVSAPRSHVAGPIGIFSPWGSSNYGPPAPFLYEVASHVKNCRFDPVHF